jgi:hypothetical protein
MDNEKNTKKFINDSILKEVTDALASLTYGTVTIKMHDAKIIQIEVAQRKRFDDIWLIEEGGGI